MILDDKVINNKVVDLVKLYNFDIEFIFIRLYILVFSKNSSLSQIFRKNSR